MTLVYSIKPRIHHFVICALPWTIFLLQTGEPERHGIGLYLNSYNSPFVTPIHACSHSNSVSRWLDELRVAALSHSASQCSMNFAKSSLVTVSTAACLASRVCTSEAR